VVNLGFAKGKLSMEFKKGLTVVYPHHGAAEILEVAKKEFRGEKKLYLKLKVEQETSLFGFQLTQLNLRLALEMLSMPRVSVRLKPS
jgi:RNA polymerase-interacting CarD/CdnL/TRCF family regulator